MLLNVIGVTECMHIRSVKIQFRNYLTIYILEFVFQMLWSSLTCGVEFTGLLVHYNSKYRFVLQTLQM